MTPSLKGKTAFVTGAGDRVAVLKALRKHFRSSEIVELVLTARFYAMVPRVLNALRVPIEKDTLHAPVGAQH